MKLDLQLIIRKGVSAINVIVHDLESEDECD